MSSDFPAVFLKPAHLLGRSLDQVGSMSDLFDAPLPACRGHDEQKPVAAGITADLISDLLAAPIEQPYHVTKLAQGRRDV
jgi:hypothetical protein